MYRNHFQNENKTLCEYCIKYIKNIKSYYFVSHIIVYPMSKVNIFFFAYVMHLVNMEPSKLVSEVSLFPLSLTMVSLSLKAFCVSFMTFAKVYWELHNSSFSFIFFKLLLQIPNRKLHEYYQ